MLKCYYTNCDSLINKFDEFKTRIEESQPHIICLTEVKPKNSRYPILSSELQLQDYEIFNNLNDSGRGIVIYVKKAIQATVLSDISDFKESISHFGWTLNLKEVINL